MATNTFDALIVGAGQGGGPIATTLGNAGWRVALIEREHVGGTCVNVGCTPTKTMVASGRVAHLARRGADYGVKTGPVSVDMQVVRERKRAMVSSFRGGSERSATQTPNLELIRGEASFVGPKTLDVRLNEGGSRQVSAETIILDVGTRTAIPKLDGLSDVPYLTSTTIMELDSVPEHLIILGGGYIGLEFGQMFRRFGARVTIVQRGGQLLGREDQDVADEVAAILTQDGIDVLLNTEAIRVSQTDGTIRLVTKGQSGHERAIDGSHLLVAAGRISNADSLNLPAAGIVTDKRGFIQVDERLSTNVPGVYAIGDANGGPAFTHISYDDFRILRANLLGEGGATTNGRLIPYTVFIDPQLGRVGLSEQQAAEQGLNFKVAKIPMSRVARALETDETRGFMKAIVDPESKQILGAAVLGIEGGEVASMLQIAMMGKLPYTALRDAVFSHPTISEALNNLFSSL